MSTQTANQLPQTGDAGNSDPLYQELQSELARFGQEHILRFWNELDSDARQELADQVRQLDLQEIEELFHGFGEPVSVPTDAESYSEPAGFSLNDPHPRFSRAQAIEAGRSVLRAGTVGIVIVAGGQGTRLGFAHPKGMYPIGPLSKATLFEILLQKAQAVSRRYGKNVPVYLMTSPATHEETVRFLEENNRFGMSADDLIVFCQGTMPAVDIGTGKLLLADKHSLFRSPDGHGGMLAGLRNSGAFDHMKQRGIEHLFYMQIDNPLVDVAAADAIGYHVLANSEATTMVIRKDDPLEKVGNVATLNGKTQIVEYSDLPEDVARLQRDDGSLLLWAGNVAVHVWDVSFLESVANSTKGLPFHFARKKVPHLDENGELIKPEEPNGIKFERFIFDLLPEARRSIVVEVDREASFAPLKNPSGTPKDSPEAVQSQMARQYRTWIEAAGGKIADGVTVEILPSFAATPEELAGKIDEQTVFEQDQVLR